MGWNKNTVGRLKRPTLKLIPIILIFIISGIIYCLIEIAYRGYTHYSMFLCAGMAGIAITFLNDWVYEFNTDFRTQCITAGLICSGIEFIIGEFFNRDYSIWDYRGLWGTIKCLDSQVNVMFVCAWIVICAFAIPFLDYLQWKLGMGEKPWYRIGNRIIRPWEEKE